MPATRKQSANARNPNHQALPVRSRSGDMKNDLKSIHYRASATSPINTGLTLEPSESSKPAIKRICQTKNLSPLTKPNKGLIHQRKAVVLRTKTMLQIGLQTILYIFYNTPRLSFA